MSKIYINIRVSTPNPGDMDEDTDDEIERIMNANKVFTKDIKDENKASTEDRNDCSRASNGIKTSYSRNGSSMKSGELF